MRFAVLPLVPGWFKKPLARYLVIILALFGFFILYKHHNGCYSAEEEAHAWFFSVVPANLSTSPVTKESTCHCSRPLSEDYSSTTSSSLNHYNYDTLSGSDPQKSAIESTCDSYASRRGAHQLVISYSLYGDFKGQYFDFARKNVERAAKLYPGWNVRIYHAVDTTDRQQLNMLCQMWCRYPQVDFCQVGALPHPVGDQSRIFGMLWRFMVLGDPLVDRVLFRDLDSVPTEREVAAVEQWITTNRTWHVMHDNPSHDIAILGGMWGGKNEDLNLTTKIRELLIADGRLSYVKGFDQLLLTKHVAPIVAHDSDYLNHDSFTCTKYFRNFTPWPMRRLPNRDFVGSPSLLFNSSIDKPCPKRCRPKDHPDWTYC